SLADNDYWYGQARKALAPYLLAGNVRGASLADLVRWIDTQERTEVEQALLISVDRANHGRPVPAGDTTVDNERWEALRDATVALVRAYLTRVEASDRRALAEVPFEQWPLELVRRIEDLVESEWLTEAQAAVRQRGGEQLLDVMAPLNTARALWNK